MRGADGLPRELGGPRYPGRKRRPAHRN